MVRFLGGRQSHAAAASHDCCGDGRGIAARPSALPASTTAAYVLAVASPAEGTVGGVRVGAIVGTCEAMCPAPERERRARLSDIQVGCCAGLLPWHQQHQCGLHMLRVSFGPLLQMLCAPVFRGLQIFERTDLANSAETSASLAVKRFARTVSTLGRIYAVARCAAFAGSVAVAFHTCALNNALLRGCRLMTPTTLLSTSARGGPSPAPWPTCATCWTSERPPAGHGVPAGVPGGLLGLASRMQECLPAACGMIRIPAPRLSLLLSICSACREDARLGLVHKFLWDRYRSVRQDLYIQGMDVSDRGSRHSRGHSSRKGQHAGTAGRGSMGSSTSRAWICVRAAGAAGISGGISGDIAAGTAVHPGHGCESQGQQEQSQQAALQTGVRSVAHAHTLRLLPHYCRMSFR